MGNESKKLLLADDSITIQKVVELVLADEGFELKLANNGEEAMEALPSFMPDIVLADLEMPVMGGYELCRNIKSQGFKRQAARDKRAGNKLQGTSYKVRN